MIDINPKIPKSFDFLMQPKRYKVAYGGRGAGKSTAIAQTLLVNAIQRKELILCTREFQSSIKDSVHRLLAEQIDAMGANELFDVQQRTIIGKSWGSEFIFDGLRHNINSIRSKQGITKCWAEEAHTVSDNSWDILIPTIRLPGSEIWISFNPDIEDDATYQRFVINPPTNSIVKKVGWQDNPWFKDTEMYQEMLDLKQRDYDAYLHVWEGNCKAALEGAIYKEELRIATEESRITKVPYDPSKPVSTFWDLGWADATSIVFFQQVGLDYHIIDYVENRFQKMDFYMQAIQKKDYTYKMHWLPHDAESNTISNKTPAAIMREKGFPISITPKLSVEQGIQAARAVFPRCLFDEEKCYDLLKALRNYHYERVEDKETFKSTPNHNWASHAADAFRYFAVAVSDDRKRVTRIQPRGGSWMSA